MPGPVKLDFIFGELHADEPPWRPEPEAISLPSIATSGTGSCGLRSKRAKGQTELVASELRHDVRPHPRADGRRGPAGVPGHGDHQLSRGTRSARTGSSASRSREPCTRSPSSAARGPRERRRPEDRCRVDGSIAAAMVATRRRRSESRQERTAASEPARATSCSPGANGCEPGIPARSERRIVRSAASTGRYAAATAPAA